MRKLAAENRREATGPERRLWSLLRKSQLGGLKFRRQAVIDHYIVDFLCPAKKLVVEVDGESHVGRGEVDDTRTRNLEARGYRVLRVTNDDVLRDLEAVGMAILQATGLIGDALEPSVDPARLLGASPTPQPPPSREGESVPSPLRGRAREGVRRTLNSARDVVSVPTPTP